MHCLATARAVIFSLGTAIVFNPAFHDSANAQAHEATGEESLTNEEAL